MIKYEYEITELQHGIYTIKVGALGLCVAIALYLSLVVFYDGIRERDSLIKTVLFLVIGLVGLFHFLKGLYLIYFKKGRWLFRLDGKGVYLLTPEGVEKLIALDRITSLDVVEDDHGRDTYHVSTKDSLVLSIGLPIRVDYFSIVRCFEQLGVDVNRLYYKSVSDYIDDLLSKKIEHQSFIYSTLYRLN